MHIKHYVSCEYFINDKYTSFLQNGEIFPKAYELARREDVCTFQKEAF